MATIEIADNDARVQYTQAVTANTTQLTIDFPFFDLDDINVIVTTAAVLIPRCPEVQALVHLLLQELR